MSVPAAPVPFRVRVGRAGRRGLGFKVYLASGVELHKEPHARHAH